MHNNYYKIAKIKKYFLFLIVAWTAVISIGIYIDYLESMDMAVEMARMEAKGAFEKDLIYRKWVAHHGGVYVEIDENHPPNKYLDSIKDRDITSTSGKKLTLINPAYMTRKVFDMEANEYLTRGHITSLNLLRPENEADVWEKKALKIFEKGHKEYYEISILNNKEYLRFMRPMFMDESCKKCHGHQGYKIGDVRGGISISVPMEAHENIAKERFTQSLYNYILFWVLGFVGILFAKFKTNKVLIRQLEDEESLRIKDWAINSSINAIVIIDRNDKIEFVNDSFLRDWGFNSTSEVVGRSIKKIWSNENRYKSISKMIDEMGYWNGEDECVRKDGTLFLCQISISSINDDNDNKNYRMISFIDITEKKKLQNEVNRISKLESLSILAGGIAHNFKNILTSMSLSAEIAKKNPRKTEKHLDKISLGIEQAAAIASRFQMFSSDGDISREIVDLNEVIYDAESLAFSGKEVKSELHLSEQLYKVNVDAKQLNEVLMNLYLNAIDAVDKHGKVITSSKNVFLEDNEVPFLEEGKYIKIKVEDNGCGISESAFEEVFTPFFTTKANGHGLGLSSVHSIIKKHGGAITLDSKEGFGSRFEFYLPVSEKIDESTDKVKCKEDFEKHVSILLIEDNEEIGNSFKELSEGKNFTVHTEQDGSIAVEKYVKEQNNTKFDLVILDLTLEKGYLSGEDVIKMLVKVDPDVKAIVFSAHSNESIMAEYKDYGFKGQLNKPMKIEEFFKEVNRVLNMRCR